MRSMDMDEWEDFFSLGFIWSMLDWKNGFPKGYTEMGRFFYLGIHIKCAGPVTLSLLKGYLQCHDHSFQEL